MIGNRLNFPSAGKILYNLWYRPQEIVAQIQQAGGYRFWRRQANGRKAMRAQAKTLRLPNGRGEALEVHVLTGAKFWEQTAFMLWSLGSSSNRPLSPFLYDDGSLQGIARTTLMSLTPNLVIRDAVEIQDLLDEVLPFDKFPTLRGRRLTYPNLKKITDIHAGSKNWRLVMDSDMLFFRDPVVLRDWLDAPFCPLHAVDVETSYGYSPKLMERLSGKKIEEKINVGVCGLSGAELDWDRLEYWCRTLEETEGTHYFLEQALIAMELSMGEKRVLSSTDYVTLPSESEIRSPCSVMHHYVAGSKRDYFTSAWKKAIERHLR